MATTESQSVGPYTTQEARIDLAAAHRLAVIEGMKDLALGNHFTLLDPEDPERMLATPAQEPWPLITASGLELIDSREQAEADHHLWINYRIHWPIHRSRPDAACVLHVHPTYLTVLSMIDTDLNGAEQMAIYFRDKVAFTDQFDTAVGGLGMEQGEYLAEQLGDRVALVMRNHGITVVGPTVAFAYSVLSILEQAAKCQVIAMSTGRSFLDVPEDVLGEFLGQETGGHWNVNFAAMKRLLDRREPDYKN